MSLCSRPRRTRTRSARSRGEWGIQKRMGHNRARDRAVLGTARGQPRSAIWARHLPAAREQTVLESHVQNWLSRSGGCRAHGRSPPRRAPWALISGREEDEGGGRSWHVPRSTGQRVRRKSNTTRRSTPREEARDRAAAQQAGHRLARGGWRGDRASPQHGGVPRRERLGHSPVACPRGGADETRSTELLVERYGIPAGAARCRRRAFIDS